MEVNGKFEDAIQHYHIAQGINPKSLKIQCFLGWCFFKLEWFEKVSEVIQKAEEIFEQKSS